MRLCAADVPDFHAGEWDADLLGFLASIIVTGRVDDVHACEAGMRWLGSADAGGMDVRSLLSSHRELMGGMAKSRFREKVAIVGVRSREGFGFVAPVYDVRAEIAWMLEQATARAMPLPALVASVLFYFLHVHPFPDGNGRVSRVLLPRLLIAQGGAGRLGLLLFALAHFQVEKTAFVRALYQERVTGSGAFPRYVVSVMERGKEFVERVVDQGGFGQAQLQAKRDGFLGTLSQTSLRVGPP